LRPAPSAFPGGGPGVRSAAIDPPGHGGGAADVPSALRHWPIQLHLVNPRAPHFRDARLLVAADCVAFALGAFHDHLGGKSLVIGCPKLDSRVEVYAEKIEQMIDGANLRDITVMAMEVPCCGGLAQLVCAARSRARRYLPVELATVGLRGEILATREV
jgi:hypothetical protein